jgi:hypothetical protein
MLSMPFTRLPDVAAERRAGAPAQHFPDGGRMACRNLMERTDVCRSLLSFARLGVAG